MNKLDYLLLFPFFTLSLCGYSNSDFGAEKGYPGIKAKVESSPEDAKYSNSNFKLKKSELGIKSNKKIGPYNEYISKKYSKPTLKNREADISIKTRNKIEPSEYLKESLGTSEKYKDLKENATGIKNSESKPKVIIPAKSRDSKEYRSMRGLVKQKKKQTISTDKKKTESLLHYQFKTDSCTFRASYDPNKIDLKTLKNTRLLEFTNDFKINTPVFLEDYFLEPEEAILGMKKLAKECEKKLKTLKDINAFVATPYIENFRYRTYKMSLESCRAKFFMLESYDSIEVLNNYPYSNEVKDDENSSSAKNCKSYVDALIISKEYLSQFWKGMKLQQDPNINIEKLRIPSKMNLTFDILEGWHSCIMDTYKKPIIDPDNNDFLNLIEDLGYKCKTPEEFEDEEEYNEEDDY